MKTYRVEAATRTREELEPALLEEAKDLAGHDRLKLVSLDVSKTTNVPDRRLGDGAYYKGVAAYTEAGEAQIF